MTIMCVICNAPLKFAYETAQWRHYLFVLLSLMSYMRNKLVFSLLLMLLAGYLAPLHAQRRDTARVYIWPPVLYSGVNELTISSANGLQEIKTNHTLNIRIENDKSPRCAKQHHIRVFVDGVTRIEQLQLQIIDCAGKVDNEVIGLEKNWDVETIPTYVPLGNNSCREFHINPRDSGGRAPGDDIILDSITVPDSHVTLKLPTQLPTTIPGNHVFRYDVCFNGDKEGIYKFPVITWIRRTYPSGGYTTYAVADTGLVRVFRPNRPDTTRAIQRPDIIEPPMAEPPVSDPTTFRSVGVPNAIIPPAHTAFFGSYDLLGLEAGYSITDNLMVLAGGAIPTPDDWSGIHGEMFGAYSIGLKAGLNLTPRLAVAAGYQWGRSTYDLQSTPSLDSRITVNVPYLAASYGDNDSRISATIGYAYKYHETPAELFNREAWIAALGGDYRFANHWKVAGEIAAMKSLGVIPIIGTVRYFTNNYAIDLGLAFVGITTEGGTAPAIPLAPVISGVFVW
jgi:hypothetical protein